MPSARPIQAVNTRRFRDIEEVKQVAGYLPDHPVSKASYKCILGFYNFKEEVRCCRETENGRICKEGHKFGYVVQLLDHSSTIVGNNCATTKFGDDSQIRADANRMTNEIERMTRVERLGELLGNRDQILAALLDAQKRTDELRSRLHSNFQMLGPHTRSKLRDISKTGNGTIEVIGFRRKVIQTDDGEDVDITRVPIRLGALVAAKLLEREGFVSVQNGRLRIVRAFTMAAKLEKNPRSKALRELVGVIADYPRVIENANKLEALEPAFNSNDFSLFCYLDHDKGERLLAAQFVCTRLGLDSSAASAKRWLEEQDRLRCQAYRVSSLRVV